MRRKRAKALRLPFDGATREAARMMGPTSANEAALLAEWFPEAPEGYWQRGWRAYGRPGDFVLARLYWPTNDPKPTRAWW